jgi:hypothetical protein
MLTARCVTDSGEKAIVRLLLLIREDIQSLLLGIQSRY